MKIYYKNENKSIKKQKPKTETNNNIKFYIYSSFGLDKLCHLTMTRLYR